jgi:hypothetical protein
MDVTKWTAVFLGIVSIVSAGCCNQPCSWGNWGSTYAPPPPQPVYQQSYPAPVYSAPVAGPPMTGAPVTSVQPQ